MTKPRYPQGCVAMSQVPGRASRLCADDESYAWYVNFNYGNSNINHRNNNGYVLACRPASECQGAVSFQELKKAWRRARWQKCGPNQLDFEADWIDGLLDLQEKQNAGTWSPSPSICFIASRPKAREIHAPEFADRIVHHWLVPQLEAIYEPRFSHDSYANRCGKGTHAAVQRLQAFARQVDSGQGGGWYLQLDIKNFFNCIDRRRLWWMLKGAMVRGGISPAAQQATHALLRQHPLAPGVTYHATAAERATVPVHKRLANSGRGRGLPIGNLSSQFFANVYLDRLDQFVKHQLKAPRYLRYVDDFVLAHRDRAQLQAWLPLIETFLREQLGLELKADIKLRPLTAGIDFLGYVVWPTHTAVRRRVIGHAHEALSSWARLHVRHHRVRATPADLRQLTAQWRSYEGHFTHANSFRLRQRFHRRYPWLMAATINRNFPLHLEGRHVTIPLTEAA